MIGDGKHSRNRSRAVKAEIFKNKQDVCNSAQRTGKTGCLLHISCICIIKQEIREDLLQCLCVMCVAGEMQECEGVREDESDWRGNVWNRV